MKKILFLFALCLGMFSFTSPELVNLSTEEHDVIELSSSNDYQVTSKIVESDNFKVYICTATVSYYGVDVATFTGTAGDPVTACLYASMSAQIYISQNGGTWP